MRGVFLDTETSGLDPFVHVPLELAFVIVTVAFTELEPVLANKHPINVACTPDKVGLYTVVDVLTFATCAET